MRTRLFNSGDDNQDWGLLAAQAGWSVKKLAKLCNMSVRTLERHFIKTIGKTPKIYLLDHRQKRGLELLQDGLSVKEIALQLGYRHTQHFSRAYKRIWGACPAVHRSLAVSQVCEPKREK